MKILRWRNRNKTLLIVRSNITQTMSSFLLPSLKVSDAPQYYTMAFILYYILLQLIIALLLRIGLVGS